MPGLAPKSSWERGEAGASHPSAAIGLTGAGAGRPKQPRAARSLFLAGVYPGWGLMLCWDSVPQLSVPIKPEPRSRCALSQCWFSAAPKVLGAGEGGRELLEPCGAVPWPYAGGSKLAPGPSPRGTQRGGIRGGNPLWSHHHSCPSGCVLISQAAASPGCLGWKRSRAGQPSTAGLELPGLFTGVGTAVSC